jgi:hypothetical protein
LLLTNYTLLVTPLLGPSPHIYTIRQFLRLPLPWTGRKRKKKKQHTTHIRVHDWKENGEPIRVNRQPEGLGTTTTERVTSNGF